MPTHHNHSEEFKKGVELGKYLSKMYDIPSPTIGWRIFLSTILIWTSIGGLFHALLRYLNFSYEGHIIFYLLVFLFSFLYLASKEKYIQHIL
jgi:hypothetical protein